MEELLIVNPARRPKKRRSNPSPAQKRARAKFAAMARARSTNPKRRRTSAKRRRNPISVSVSRPAASRRSRRRSNPINLSGVARKPMALLGPALTGAIGSIVVNNVLARLPLPAAAMTGKMRYVTQGAAAIALALLAQRMGVKGAVATQAAEGALTVTLADFIKETAAGAGVNLSGMGYYLPGLGVRAAPPSGGRGAPQLSGVGKYMTGPGASRVVPMPQRMNGMGSGVKSRFAF